MTDEDVFALREFIQEYYYGSAPDDLIAADANALLEWMEERGFKFERTDPAALSNQTEGKR